MRGSRRVRISVAVLIALLGLLALKEIFTIGLAEVAAGRNLGSLAYSLRPTNSRGTALYGEQMLSTNPRSAERLAQAAILASPIDVVAVRVLGEARNRRAEAQGNALMLLAGSLSWRDRPTQLWLVRQAVLTGEVEIAVQRAEALARLQRGEEIAFSLLRLMALAPDARGRLVRTLAAGPFWRQRFLSPDDPIPYLQLRAMALLLRELDRTTAPPTSREARYTIDGLVVSNHAEEAGRLHLSLFPRSGGGNRLVNGDFEQPGADYVLGGTSSHFDWSVSSAGEAEAAVDSEGGRNRVLLASSEGVIGGRIALQMAVLQPGAYEFSYRVRSEFPNALGRFKWVVFCAQGAPPFLLETPAAALPADRWVRRSHGFTVPAGCSVQNIELRTIETGQSEPVEARFDDLSVRPVR